LGLFGGRGKKQKVACAGLEKKKKPQREERDRQSEKKKTTTTKLEAPNVRQGKKGGRRLREAKKSGADLSFGLRKRRTGGEEGEKKDAPGNR